MLRDQVPPFEFRRVHEGSYVGFVRFFDMIRRFVGDRTRVVLVGKTCKMVAELVNEYVGSPFAVCRDCPIQTIDTTAAVGLTIGEYLDEIVWH